LRLALQFFRRQNIGKKVVQKMLMKLTPFFRNRMRQRVGEITHWF
jgi:hypothetical protein